MVSRTSRVGLIGLAALVMAAPLTCAQDAPPKSAASPDPVVATASPAALVAIVLDVQGRAEVRIDPQTHEDLSAQAAPNWQPIERGMELPINATLRTGARSAVTLRLGLNATVRVNSFARARIGELAKQEQPGQAATLRTTLMLERGDLDVRVDHVDDAANDFAIVTQAATLAVRGTNFSVGIDGIDGLRIQGAQTNSFRAIEVKYVADEQETALSRGRLDDAWRNPALAALANTLDAPNAGVHAQGYLNRLGMPVTQLVTGTQRAGEQLAVVRELEIRTVTAEQVLDGIGSGKDGPAPRGESVGGR
ncbi:MAG: FecR domain-containing protein [Phycisphaerales bacterium]|nr:FecR domain-containing protein [Phycisphaerales bacterium]